MSKQDLQLALAGTVILVGFYYGLKSGKGVLYYLALFLLIAPAAGLIGYGLGKEMDV